MDGVWLTKKERRSKEESRSFGVTGVTPDSTLLSTLLFFRTIGFLVEEYTVL